MSLFQGLSASLTALNSQSENVASISANVANISTTGYKAQETSFATLVTGSAGGGGGVLASFRNNIDEQGSIESTGVGTDLAIQGGGFLPVQDTAGNIVYTRAGSFRTNSSGELVNEAGYRLLAWNLDSEGRLPGESGNTEFPTSNQDLASLAVVSEATITGTASPTSLIDAKINLDADEQILAGSGDTVTFASTGSNSGIASTDVIVPSNADMASGTTLTITPGDGTVSEFVYGGFTNSYDITDTSIGGASTASGAMTGFTDGDDFTVTVGSNDAITFTYQTAPSLDSNEFSNLNELAQIMNAATGITARVSSNTLYVAAEDVGADVTFADPNSSGLVTDFNFSNINGASNVFSTLSQLNTLINNSTDFVSTIASPAGNSTLTINNIDSTDSVTFTDDATNNALIADLGLTTSTVAAAYAPSSTTTPLRSMASGNISPDFSRSITVFTSLGSAMTLRVAFVKLVDGTASTGGQTWGVELYSQDPNDVVVAGRSDGLLASGEVTFDGTGALTNVPSSFASVSIQPSGGAAELDIEVDFGTLGTTDGLSQFAGSYNVDALEQNGFPTGRLQSLEINTEGFVTAIFDNSLTSQEYKIPLIRFPSPNSMTPETGNAYSANSAAGEPTLSQVGDASVGTIVPFALEASTAKIGSELTKMIEAQNAYSAGAQILRNINELFEELKNIG